MQEVIGELLRTVAYIAEREKEGTVNYDTLQADFLKPMANKSVLQEIGLSVRTCMVLGCLSVRTCMVLGLLCK